MALNVCKKQVSVETVLATGKRLRLQQGSTTTRTLTGSLAICLLCLHCLPPSCQEDSWIIIIIMTETMDRGTDALKSHVANISQMDIRQTCRGWLQECCGCESRSEFKYFVDGTQVAQSLEDGNCCCRCWCGPCHPFTMEVKELNTDAEMLTFDRPCACCVSSCKCCCRQKATVTSGGQPMGSLKEQCWCCIPTFTLLDRKGQPVYTMHQPTCLGCCVNPCTEVFPFCFLPLLSPLSR